ncbi:NYN domain-containing protein [Alysiella filiformis]|uniref:TIGR00288 family protein n=1 Tax=Alysiella filiformis DSM 16848 TaxID=1120981 RepID=A0A286E314_9NEIS|nr:NYN domain-containing protein [Alysiella filiformis]QMT31142.1 NYN domain-containing protein [Alysiella filiformis]UBQ55866.1 NYN domain-containing protein [Alysiella filiformis DSM 16848]SOD65308.1 TIGR00288 family protein [Alysiella filiformis DSM 16848]
MSNKIKTSFNIVEEKSARLAVLIDADNASAKDVKAILEEVAKFGEATVKRIYGNFVSANGQWKQVINELAIKPMQQFAFTTGKNATDGFMIIDAMDLLYTNRFDGFCIVSSDSDFTALAIRLKEHGTSVYGFGKKQTPAAFRNACSQFIYVENLVTETEECVIQENTLTDKTQINQSNENKLKNNATNKNTELEVIQLPLDTLRKVFENFDDEWVGISAFGATWKRLQVDIDPRTYGCSKFTTLIKKYPEVFDYEMRKVADGEQEHMYVKLKI